MFPLVLHLQPDGIREILGEHQDGAQHVFGNGTVENAPRVGDGYIAPDQIREHQGIDAGTGGVDPLELVCGVPGGREGLRAKVRHHHDIGARQGVAKGWLVTGKAHIGAGPDCVHSRRFLLSRRGENGNNRFAVLSH